MIGLIVTFLVFGAMGAAMLFMNSFLGPRKRSAAKDRPFECGSPYLQKDIPPVSIPFALVALFFLLFAVEAAFFSRGPLCLKAPVGGGSSGFWDSSPFSFPGLYMPGRREFSIGSERDVSRDEV